MMQCAAICTQCFIELKTSVWLLAWATVYVNLYFIDNTQCVLGILAVHTVCTQLNTNHIPTCAQATCLTWSISFGPAIGHSDHLEVQNSLKLSAIIYFKDMSIYCCLTVNH